MERELEVWKEEWHKLVAWVKGGLTKKYRMRNEEVRHRRGVKWFGHVETKEFMSLNWTVVKRYADLARSGQTASLYINVNYSIYFWDSAHIQTVCGTTSHVILTIIYIFIFIFLKSIHDILSFRLIPHEIATTTKSLHGLTRNI